MRRLCQFSSELLPCFGRSEFDAVDYVEIGIKEGKTSFCAADVNTNPRWLPHVKCNETQFSFEDYEPAGTQTTNPKK